VLQKPTARQAKFVIDLGAEALYGGAAGGGKSSAILMAALQFVDIPKYAAIIFRRTYSDLALPGALMDRAFQWLGSTDAKWESQEKTWRFPSGATLSFGYLDNVRDRFRYQSSEFQFVGFDELTQFKEVDYLYLFSRLRRTVNCNVPLRMRGGTNPGGVGHLWVKKRFLGHDSISSGRVFVPAKMGDNQHLDRVEYEASLNKLDSFTRKQLKEGDWTDFQGNYFYPARWPRYRLLGASVDATDAFSIQTSPTQRHIYHRNDCTIRIGLDWALNKRRRRAPGENPEWVGDEASNSDYNAFVVDALTTDGNSLILDCVNERIRPEHKAPTLAALCRRWRPHIVCGDDDMLSETMLLDCRRQRDIPEIRCLPISGKKKAERAMAAIIRGENGLIYLPESAPWLETFCDNLVSFTGEDDEHDDIADALGILGRLSDELKGDGREEAMPDVLTPATDRFAGW
jgi:predicted phage terminase large subunit-like protein